MTAKRKFTPAPISPDVLEARRVLEGFERQIILGAANSYFFYQYIKPSVCPYDPATLSHRQDFNTGRYNSLWALIAAFYYRFEHLTLEKDINIPVPVLSNLIADSCNKERIAIDLAEQLTEEVTSEEAFTKSLTYDSSMALAKSPAFQDWLSTRIAEQTVGLIDLHRSLRTLTMDTLEQIVAKAKESVSMLGTKASELARPIGEFQIPAEDDMDMLIGPHRFLCYEAIATLVGPSGIGKSTLAMQMAMAFALGREIFGFKPRAALKILIIQGENDDGDIAEMRDGTIAGHKLSDEDKARVSANVMCCRCNSATGRKFIQGPVRNNLQRFKPDLLIIDPALCYVGGDTKEQRVVGEFLRSDLLPELQRAKCGCLLLHHTNKPPTQNPKGGTSNEDAYAESGSAEFRNVARAVITLRPIGDGSVYELRVPKRGNRLGWTDDDGQPTTRRYVRHSADRDRLFWEHASYADAHKAMAAVDDDKSEANAEKLLACIARHGEISQNNLLAEAKKLGIGNKVCREAVESLLEGSKIICTGKPRSGARPEKFYSRVTKTSIPGGETI
jgi:hypothetical protein